MNLTRTKELMVWGPAETSSAARREAAEEVLALMAAIVGTPERATPPADLEYERWVERPRRHGTDPVWRALMAEAAGQHADSEAA